MGCALNAKMPAAGKAANITAGRRTRCSIRRYLGPLGGRPIFQSQDTRHSLIGSRVQIPRPEKRSHEDSSLKTKLAFYSWLALLLITLGTFAAGLFGHFVTLIAAPWLSLRTQAAIHAAIPVLLTAVKFVTVPLLLLLTPFARRHPTFRSWTGWSKAKFRQLERIVCIPWSLAKALFLRAISMFLCREAE